MKRHRIFYGWYVVIALFIVGIVTSSVRYMLPIFTTSFIKDFGWPRTTIGFAFTLNFWIASVGGPLIGLLIDRFGGRVITTIGGIFLVSSLVLLSTMTNVTQFYIYYSLIAGLGICCTFYVPLNSIPRKWFIKRAGLAVSLALIGAGLGLAIAPPIANILIDQFGWRKAFIIFGIPSGLLSIVIAATVIRDSPESIGLLPDGERPMTLFTPLKETINSKPYLAIGEQNFGVKDAMNTSSFWFLNFAYGLSLIGIMGVIPHMVTWAQDLHIGRGSVAFALFILGIFSVSSRILGGIMRDRFGGKVPIGISMVGLMIISLYALTINQVISLYIFSVLAGIFYGLNLPAWIPLLGDLFGRKSVGTLMGVLSLSFGFISGSGPAIFGWIFDHYGTYHLGFIFSTICYLIALVLILLIKKPQPKLVPV